MWATLHSQLQFRNILPFFFKKMAFTQSWIIVAQNLINYFRTSEVNEKSRTEPRKKKPIYFLWIVFV